MFGAVLLLLPSPLAAAAVALVFSPAMFLAGWQADPGVALLSPLVSQVAQIGLFAAAFNALLLLIAGRHVERLARCKRPGKCECCASVSSRRNE